MLRRKHLLTTLLLGLLWGIILLVVAYTSWEAGLPGTVTSSGDALFLGIALGLGALVITYVLLRRVFPTESIRATRWRQLADLVDEMDERDLNLLRQQLSRPSEEYYDEERLTVDELLHEEKQKRGQTNSQRY